MWEDLLDESGKNSPQPNRHISKRAVRKANMDGLMSVSVNINFGDVNTSLEIVCFPLDYIYK